MKAGIRKVLVTGGAGFIGGHLVDALLRENAQVVVLDNLRSGTRETVQSKELEFIDGSITDRDAVRRAVQGCDEVFHLAGMVSVAESMTRPHECVELNVTGLLNVLEEAASAGVRKLVFSSSAAIYGDDPTVPKRETMAPAPKSPYAITKLDGEHYCAMFTETRGIETVCLRYFNVFGPRQNPASAYAAAVPIFIHQALAGEPITIHGDGGQTRDFVYVKDVVAANLFAAATAGLTGVFNVGYGERLTIRGLAEEILNATGNRSVLRHQGVRAGDVRHSLAAPDKLFAAGFKPTYTLPEALAETLEWYRSKCSPR